MKTKLEKLYNQRILTLNKSPYHFREMEACDIMLEANNPICGDNFRIYLTINDQKIQTASFSGFGCALSKASTSMLVRDIEGMPLNEAITYAKSFLASFQQDEPTDIADLDLLINLKAHGGRVDCMELSWKTLAAHAVT